MSRETLLAQKRASKKKKPFFARQDAHKLKKLQQHWRKPRGSDSKMRVGKRGYKRSVEPGWGSPRSLRGMNRDGKKEILVRNMNDLITLKKGDIIILASVLGTKKKITLITKAKELGLIIRSIKNPDSYISTIQEEMKKKKEGKKKKEDEKKEKQKKLEEKAEKKEAKKEEETSDEEKKEKEKKELDKILTSKKLMKE